MVLQQPPRAPAPVAGAVPLPLTRVVGFSPWLSYCRTARHNSQITSQVLKYLLPLFCFKVCFGRNPPKEVMYKSAYYCRRHVGSTQSILAGPRYCVRYKRVRSFYGVGRWKVCACAPRALKSLSVSTSWTGSLHSHTHCVVCWSVPAPSRGKWGPCEYAGTGMCPWVCSRRDVFRSHWRVQMTGVDAARANVIVQCVRGSWSSMDLSSPNTQT